MAFPYSKGANGGWSGVRFRNDLELCLSDAGHVQAFSPLRSLAWRVFFLGRKSPSKRAPGPASVNTSIFPPGSLANSLQIASPRPVPTTALFGRFGYSS